MKCLYLEKGHAVVPIEFGHFLSVELSVPFNPSSHNTEDSTLIIYSGFVVVSTFEVSPPPADETHLPLMEDGELSRTLCASRSSGMAATGEAAPSESLVLPLPLSS
ncbi:unnamed protein product [Pleuronectes platessa]|uniref:Uncharacterized protein n=1 Tax=Pleuronectes platessa TaxID=8262 RepID=A0A9N7ZC25_PLEPL|nr:unnamed protein product [Pleuronectes platessa]